MAASPIVFDITHYLACPECMADYASFESGDRCETCNGDETMVFHRIYVTTTSSDPKDRPELTCHIIQYAPSWKEPVDGEKIVWGSSKYSPSYTTSIGHFDFTFTTDDSDVGVFEPHIDAIIEILRLPDIMKLRTDAVLSSRVKKQAVDALGIKKTLAGMEERVIADAMRGVAKAITQKSLMRWIGPIAHTLVNAVHHLKVATAIVDSTDKKPCPHISKAH